MIKVLIVDNELLAGVRIERLLAAMQNIIFVGQATSGDKSSGHGCCANPRYYSDENTYA